MNKKIRLLAIDLDDTLLRDDNTITEYTRNVLRDVKHRGVEVLIATGRMFQTAEPVAKKIGLGDLPMILFSGGLIQRVESKEILFEHLIPLELAQKLLQRGKERNWYLQSYIDDELLVDTMTDVTRRYEIGVGAKAVALGEDFYEPKKGPNKILCIEEPHRMDTIVEEMRQYMGQSLDFVRSKLDFLEIVAPQVSKGNALQFMGQKWGISLDEMVSFGNSENDISMLRITGRSVAVGNAENIAVHAAKERCATNEEDGVAKWIEQHILRGE